jgi:ketosteroid isomerase-like protein
MQQKTVAGPLDAANAVVQTEIEARLARHAQALAQGDVEACLQLYTADAIVRPANMEPVRGHEALREFFSRWFGAMRIHNAKYTTDELEVAGDSAYQIGRYEGEVHANGQAGAFSDRGSFSIVWKRQPDGGWKYHRGIFNSSLPPDPATSSKGRTE